MATNGSIHGTIQASRPSRSEMVVVLTSGCIGLTVTVSAELSQSRSCLSSRTSSPPPQRLALRTRMIPSTMSDTTRPPQTSITTATPTPTHRPINQPINLSINQSINQSISQWRFYGGNSPPNSALLVNITKYQLSLTNTRDANVLQTNVDAQCDKLATELRLQRLRRSTFSSYSQSFVESRQI